MGAPQFKRKRGKGKNNHLTGLWNDTLRERTKCTCLAKLLIEFWSDFHKTNVALPKSSSTSRTLAMTDL